MAGIDELAKWKGSTVSLVTQNNVGVNGMWTDTTKDLDKARAS